MRDVRQEQERRIYKEIKGLGMVRIGKWRQDVCESQREREREKRRKEKRERGGKRKERASG